MHFPNLLSLPIYDKKQRRSRKNQNQCGILILQRVQGVKRKECTCEVAGQVQCFSIFLHQHSLAAVDVAEIRHDSSVGFRGDEPFVPQNSNLLVRSLRVTPTKTAVKRDL